jgi:alanine racemase
MDMLTIDVTHLPQVDVGDRVELWGSAVPVERVAAAAGTIPYELVCRVGRRVTFTVRQS